MEAFPAAHVDLQIKIELVLPGSCRGSGRDSILERSIFLKAKTDRALNNTPGSFFRPKTMLVLISSARELALPRQREKARIIFRIVLDAPAQDLHPVYARCVLGSDRGRSPQCAVAYKFNASRRVVKRDLFNLLEPAQQPLALLQGRRMRIDVCNLPKSGTWMQQSDCAPRAGMFLQRSRESAAPANHNSDECSPRACSRSG